MSQLHTLRMIVATLAAVALVISVAPRAEAHHRPNFYCSESGDLCQSTRKVDGVRKLSLILAAPYFDSYRLCVTGPFRDCERFRVRALSGGLYGGRVNFERHFAVFNNMDYTVVWKAAGSRIGRRLGFHVR